MKDALKKAERNGCSPYHHAHSKSQRKDASHLERKKVLHLGHGFEARYHAKTATWHHDYYLANNINKVTELHLPGCWRSLLPIQLQAAEKEARVFLLGSRHESKMMSWNSVVSLPHWNTVSDRNWRTWTWATAHLKRASTFAPASDRNLRSSGID